MGSPPLQFKKEKLGDASNVLTVKIERKLAYGNQKPFSAEEETLLLKLFEVANPIIRELYGPPANNRTITLIQGGCDKDLNMYLKGSNEIRLIAKKNNYGDLAHPRLLIHELVHAYRDNVVLTNDAEWKYDPKLGGFEEGMAEAVALIVMDKIVSRYPNFFKSPELCTKWNHVKNMSHEWDYDFQNHKQIRNTNFFGVDKTTRLHCTRYALSATVFRKLYFEDPKIFKKFNQTYYDILNNDIKVKPSRSLIIDIFKLIKKEAEGIPIEKWLNNQKILDCKDTFEKQVIMLSTHNIHSQAFQSVNKIFLAQTHQNGSSSAWFTKDSLGNHETNEPLFSYAWSHQLNNIPGTISFIQTWDNHVSLTKNIINDHHVSIDSVFGKPKRKGKKLLGPYQGPNPFNLKQFYTQNHEQDNCSILPNCGKITWGMGSHILYTSTTSKIFFNTNFLPLNGVIKNKNVVYNMNTPGLYKLKIVFNDPKGPPIVGYYYRLYGDTFIDHYGIMGGIYSNNQNNITGRLIIEHEKKSIEAPIEIKNNSFKASRSWAAIPNLIDTNKHSLPGKIHIIYIDKNCSHPKITFRTIGYGDGVRGVQLFLFNLDNFQDITFNVPEKILVNKNLSEEINVTNNFPEILDKDPRITYRWYNEKNELISKHKKITLPQINQPTTYKLVIDFYGCLIEKSISVITKTTS